MRLLMLAASLLMLCATSEAKDPPEVTEDGLVRVPSNSRVGVYRAPDVPFTQYQRIELGTITVQFSKIFLRSNPNLKEDDLERMRTPCVSKLQSSSSTLLRRTLTRFSAHAPSSNPRAR